MVHWDVIFIPGIYTLLSLLTYSIVITKYFLTLPMEDKNNFVRFMPAGETVKHTTTTPGRSKKIIYIVEMFSFALL